MILFYVLSLYFLVCFLCFCLFLMYSVFTQPVKTSLYGTLIGLLNNRVPELGKEIVAKLCKIFQEAFDEVHPYKVFMIGFNVFYYVFEY